MASPPVPAETPQRSGSGVVVDASDGRPVYRQIADQLRGEIERGDTQPGQRLPAIRTLAGQLGVHRDTVALAYESLAEAGLVEARVGAGTFVRSFVSDVPSSMGQEERPVARRIGLLGGSERGGARDLDLALAPQVERLIALENRRPRFAPDRETVALHRLIPDPRFYPVDAFRRCVDAALREEGPGLFSYAPPEGDLGLREVMSERFGRFGIRHEVQEHVLCHGASQGISLALRLFTQPGDQVAVEVPTYANVLSAFTGLGLTPAPIPVDDRGPDPDALDRMLARPEVKAFYTIPSFHNPLGTTTPIERRREILAIAERHGVPVIEDGFELDLRFRGEEVPPLAALDEAGIVVLLFSFSKSLFPGVRVGSLSARGRALEGLVALKHATDLSDSMLLQAGLARFLRSGEYDRHLARMRKMLRSRHRAMHAALEQEMPEGTTWTQPEGGYQLWVDLPGELDTQALLPEAARAGVLYSPGTLFMPDARPSSALRLTVACSDEQEIERGVRALGRVTLERRRSEAEISRRPGDGL
jgi:DNA-binding transcriptional MocR family regulator